MTDNDEYIYDGYPDDFAETELWEYLGMSDDDLRKECANARSEKIVGIRKSKWKLSEKQRYCLAFWCIRRDERLREY